MSGVNNGKVVVGGLVAAVVMNVSQFVLNEMVLADSMTEMFEALNLPGVGGPEVAMFVAMTCVVAFTMIWLYAVARTNLGAGPKTALCIGSVVWLLYYGVPTMSFWIMGMWGGGDTVLTLAWTLVEILAAAVAGASFYSD